MPKVIRSMEEFKRYYLPKKYKKEQREKRIAEIGIMGVILEDLEKRLKSKCQTT